MLDEVSDNDDNPCLASETIEALKEFYAEQLRKQSNSIEENWQLSQFWYNKETCNTLSAAISKLQDVKNIALLSCPTLYKPLKDLITKTQLDINIALFEFDKRFECFGDDFIFYDYKDIDHGYEQYKDMFDLIVADPPFLSEECLNKVSKFISLIKNENVKLILCTGAVMEDRAQELLGVARCSFKPKHEKNLANEFICLTNFGELS